MDEIDKAAYVPPLKQAREAWYDSTWRGRLGGYGSGYWREQPRSYRALTVALWHLRGLVERPRAAWFILRNDGYQRDCGSGIRAWLIVARAVICCFLGRVEHGYPSYPEHPMAWDLASWDGRSWDGGEQTCWSAMFASVCTGRAWHVHIYEDSGP